MRQNIYLLAVLWGTVVGVVVGQLPHRTILLGILGLMFVFGFVVSVRFRVMGVLMAIGLSFGCIRVVAQDADSAVTAVQFFEQQPLVVRVVEDPVIKTASQQLVVLSVNTDGQFNVHEKILVITELYPRYRYGDYLELTGVVQVPEPFEYIDMYDRVVVFDYQKYLLSKAITYVSTYPDIVLIDHDEHTTFFASLYATKSVLARLVQRQLSEPHAALLSGLLWGARQDLPSDVLQSFGRAGVTHIIALSGFNISIISVVLFWIAPWVRIKRQYMYWVVVLSTCLFVVFVGAQASIVRAGIMGLLVLTAVYIGRPHVVFTPLCIALAGLSLYSPQSLLHDVGLHLSFAATVGVVYIAPLFDRFVKKIPNIFGLQEVIAMTVAATIATAPISAFVFGYISVVAVIANILIVPLIPLTMVLGVLLLSASFFGVYFATVVQAVTWMLLETIIVTAKTLGDMSWSAIPVSISWYVVLLYYSSMMVFLIWVNRKDIMRYTRYV